MLDHILLSADPSVEFSTLFIINDFHLLLCLQLAENLDGQLARMGDDLKEIISHLNTSAKSQDSKDPVYQIGKVTTDTFSSEAKILLTLLLVDPERPHGQSAVDRQQRPGGGEEAVRGGEAGRDPQEGLGEAAEVHAGVSGEHGHSDKLCNIFVTIRLNKSRHDP